MDALRRQLAEFPELTAAEDCLVQWFRTGKRQVCQVSNEQPAENTPEVRLRTSLLRALLLGQVKGVPPPESDVVIRGAWIYGDEPPPNDGSPRGAQPEIDLRSMALPFGLGFRHCHLADRLSLQGARLRGLWLDGSRLVQGVGAERAQVVGAVGLRDAVMDQSSRFTNAQVSGNLDIVGACFKSDPLEVQERTPDIKGRDAALDLRLCRVDGVLLAAGRVAFDGPFDLRGARVGVVADRAESWPAPGHLRLGRFQYRAFAEESPRDAPARLDWLARQADAGVAAFSPQPHAECAQALAASGHDDAARAIRFEMEHQLWQARVGRLRGGNGHWPRLLWPLVGLWAWILRLGIGYGYQPWRAAGGLAVAWFFGVVVFCYADSAGLMKPAATEVLRSPEWVLCGIDQGKRRHVSSLARIAEGRRAPGQTQVDCWRDQPEGRSWPAFSALAYSADAILPVVDLGERARWIPAGSDLAGTVLRVWLHLQLLFGWLLSGLLVAALAGVVRHDRG